MLHFGAVEPVTLELLKSLMNQDYLQQFVLVGGSALALHLGHRKSVDIDLFTTEDFDSEQVIQQLLGKYKVEILTQLPQTMIAMVNNIKVDLIRFRYPFIRDIVVTGGLRLISPEDIAPMKLDAITGRGSKKDFFDLYFLLKKIDIESLLSLYREKYAHQTTFHVIRSLTWFKDAEQDPDPFVFDKKVTWEKVKKKIINEVRKI